MKSRRKLLKKNKKKNKYTVKRRRNRTIKRRKRNKKNRNKTFKRRSNQKGGSLFSHIIDNDLFNWVIYLFEDGFNSFFGTENVSINPSIMRGQFA
tara:strand:- start:35 stop:319 length:285 start_codon:yes stop_codon:yes gene_type:complete